MEENNTYTYQRTDKKSKSADPYNRRLIMLIIAAIALLVVLGIVIGKYAGMNSAKKQDEISSSSSSEPSSSEPPETKPASPYSEGEYLVSTGGAALKFRKDHTLDSDVILEIKDGTRLTISEIFHDESAEENGSTVDYWGKTSYYGYDGWVAMSYLKNAYSGSIITPEELPSAEEPGTDESGSPSENEGESSSDAPSSDNTSSSEPSSSSENTTVAPSSPYTPGDYTVATDGSTLSFRKSASTTADIIMALPDGTKVTVTRVVDAGGSDNTRRYWGEISYLGHTGYVSMYYLEKVS